MNFTENLPYPGENTWVHTDSNTGMISQTQPAILTPLLYICTCFWKYSHWKIGAKKTKCSPLPTKWSKSGISRFARHRDIDEYNALELRIFAQDAKSAKEQCRQVLLGSAFLNYVSHVKPSYRRMR